MERTLTFCCDLTVKTSQNFTLKIKA